MNSPTIKECHHCKNKDIIIDNLSREVESLRSKLDELHQHPIIKAGIQGESLIVALAKGTKTDSNAPFDITLKNGLFRRISG